ncbi:MAG: hypothetical protein AAF557_24645 [Pseudomonadota bacterium]
MRRSPSQRLTRRSAIGLLAATAAAPAMAQAPIRVLFIGNSFTFEHDLPLLFADIARQGGYNLHVDVMAEGGAHLADYLQTRTADQIVATYNPDLLILQDFSTVALVPDFAANSLRALTAFCRHLMPRKILFETWPRREDHKLYLQAGMPRTPAQMHNLVHAHYQSARCPALYERLGQAVAPVGRAWMLGTGLPLHRNDGYHASLTGAWLAALVLARTARLAPEAPTAPKGVRYPSRLIQIARTIVP